MKLSLKYRVALVFFILTGLMMTLTLSLSLTKFYDSNQNHLIVKENAIVEQLSDLCRIALFTSDFDDLQPYMEQISEDPNIVKVFMTNRNKMVIVSSEVTNVGHNLPETQNTETEFWRIEEIGNTSGTLGTLAIKFSRAQLIEANDEARNLGIIVALLGLLVIAIAGVLVGHLLTRRLIQLSEAAEEVAKGNLQVRTNLSGSDEIAVLGKSFDNMAEKISSYVNDLQQSDSQLRQAQTELEQRVKTRTAELAIARDEALNASNIKSKFLANMSHELRTPLNAIIGYSELLLEDARETTSTIIKDDLLKILSAGTHLLSLVNDVLDLSKIEAGKMDFYLEKFEVKSCVEEMLKSIDSLVVKNGNTLKISYSNDIGSMYADKTKVQQVLINLISNATKFAPGEIIKIQIKREIKPDKHWILFSVLDTGPGIKQQKLDSLFDEFTQLNTSESSLQKGTGLGLAICQKYCQLMGGSIKVHSTVDVGSTFIIRLPATVSTQLGSELALRTSDKTPSP